MLDCGEGPFLTTAAHVLAGFIKAKTERADTKAFVGETVIPLDERVIATDRAYDVATLRVTADEIADLKRYGKVPLTGSQSQWPPPGKPTKKTPLSTLGGDGRRVEWKGGGRVDVDFDAYTALAVASSVSVTGLSLLFEHEQTFDSGLRPACPPATIWPDAVGPPSSPSSSTVVFFHGASVAW